MKRKASRKSPTKGIPTKKTLTKKNPTKKSPTKNYNPKKVIIISGFCLNHKPLLGGRGTMSICQSPYPIYKHTCRKSLRTMPVTCILTWVRVLVNLQTVVPLSFLLCSGQYFYVTLTLKHVLGNTSSPCVGCVCVCIEVHLQIFNLCTMLAYYRHSRYMCEYITLKSLYTRPIHTCYRGFK